MMKKKKKKWKKVNKTKVMTMLKNKTAILQ